MSVIAMH